MQTLTTISPETVRLIQEVLLGCEQCSFLAETPFEQVLRNLTDQDANCILLEPAKCPSCQALVSSKTLVEIN